MWVRNWKSIVGRSRNWGKKLNELFRNANLQEGDLVCNVSQVYYTREPFLHRVSIDVSWQIIFQHQFLIYFCSLTSLPLIQLQFQLKFVRRKTRDARRWTDFLSLSLKNVLLISCVWERHWYERETPVSHFTYTCALTGNRTHSLLVHETILRSTEPPGQGDFLSLCMGRC